MESQFLALFNVYVVSSFRNEMTLDVAHDQGTFGPDMMSWSSGKFNWPTYVMSCSASWHLLLLPTRPAAARKQQQGGRVD